jgi:hypothetical protein
MFETDPNYYLEIASSGNWLLFFSVLLLVAVAVGVQEFWWRGYILPRQEISFGKRTWLLQAVLTIGTYLFLPWFLFRILPAAVAIPFLAQRFRNSLSGIVVHFALYVPLLLELFLRL